MHTQLKTRYIILSALVLISVAVSAAAPPSATRQKARYYYLEGARRQAAGELPEAYELFKKAYLTDPLYEEAASAYGMNRLLVQTDSMQAKQELKNSLAMMRPYVDAYPADIFEARSYAYVASRLDTVTEAIRVYERLDSLRPSETMTLIQLADAYMMARKQDKALEALQRYETTEGKSPQLSLKKMSFMLAKGDTLDAVAEANALIATNPKEPAFHILKGNLFEVIGDNDSVLACYKRAEALNPDNGAAKISLANYYKTVGDSVGYDRKVYEALLSEDFQMEEKLSLLSEYLQTLLDDSSDTARGDHLFEVLMEQYPHEAQVLDLAARYSGAKGEYAAAEQQIGYAIDQDPSNPQYWMQLIRYQMADKRPEEAMKTFRRAGEHIEITDAMRLMYASAAGMAKDFAEGEKMYAELIHQVAPGLPVGEKLEEDSPLLNTLGYEDATRLSSLYNMLGDMYYSAGQLDKTYEAYDNSLLFYPMNQLTLNNYAYFLAENDGDLDRALEMSRKAIDQDMENETFLDTYAWILFKKREYKEALEYQRKAIEAAEAHGEREGGELYDHLGDILFMNHLPDEALENWNKALKLDPDNALIKKKVQHKTFFFK